MTLAASIYYIWQEKNYKIFKGKRRNVDQILKQITQEIHCRCSMFLRLSNNMTLFNAYP